MTQNSTEKRVLAEDTKEALVNPFQPLKSSRNTLPPIYTATETSYAGTEASYPSASPLESFVQPSSTSQAEVAAAQPFDLPRSATNDQGSLIPEPTRPPLQTSPQPSFYPQTSQSIRFNHLQSLKGRPADVICPKCKEVGRTITTAQTGSITYIWAAIGFAATGVLCFVPFLFDATRDVSHSCSRCERPIAVYHRAAGKTEAIQSPPTAHSVSRSSDQVSVIYPSRAYSQPSDRLSAPSLPLSAFAMMTSVNPYRFAGKLAALTLKRPLVVSSSSLYGSSSLVRSLRLNSLSRNMNNQSKSSVQPGSRVSNHSPSRSAPAPQYPASRPLSGLAGDVYGNGNRMLPQQNHARLMSPNAIFAVQGQLERFGTTHSRDGGTFTPPPRYQSRNPTYPVQVLYWDSPSGPMVAPEYTQSPVESRRGSDARQIHSNASGVVVDGYGRANLADRRGTDASSLARFSPSLSNATLSSHHSDSSTRSSPKSGPVDKKP